MTPAPNSSNLSRPAAPFAHAMPGAFAVGVLAGVALLGNGLKSIVSSSVLVSEAQFAGLLGVPIEQVAALLEAIIAGMVVAAAAFATFALVDLSGQARELRVAAAFGCFALGAGALALLAPAAQALLAFMPAPATRTTLIALWTGAAPAGFLVAPQMIKYLLPWLGLGIYFLAFSALPLLLLVLLGVLGWALPAVRGAGTTVSVLPARMLLAFVAAVIAFEIWTTLGSALGYGTPTAWLGLGVMVATGLLFARELRRFTLPPVLAGPPGWLLLALFVLEMPTTGFFDTAWLAQHSFTQGFIADRSTLAAAAQIMGTLAAGWLVHRRPAAAATLLQGFAAVALAGLAAIAAYPWVAHPLYLLWTPAVQGFGAAGFTVLVCLAAVRDAARHPLLAALPSLAIMLGTEFGLELLQLVFAIARSANLSDDGAYGAIFFAQVAFASGALVLIRIGLGRQGRDPAAAPARP